MMEVYDATILQAPILLGVWQVSPATTSPQHNFNIAGGKLYVAHYNHGVFIFDLTKLPTLPGPGVLDLKPIAHYAAAPTSGSTEGLSFGQFYDAVVKDGILYASSFSGASRGVHVLGFGCNVPGDPRLTSDG